jgi:hypothetical protein
MMDEERASLEALDREAADLSEAQRQASDAPDGIDDLIFPRRGNPKGRKRHTWTADFVDVAVLRNFATEPCLFGLAVHEKHGLTEQLRRSVLRRLLLPLR